MQKANLTDLEALTPLEAVIKAQREYNALDAKMKLVKQRRQYTRERLLAEMEAANRTDDGNEDGKVKLARKLRNKVTDHAALIDYVYNLGEPVGTYLKEVFIKGNKSQGIEDPLDLLVERAAKQSIAEGKELSECMPPGLAVYTDVSIRVTLRKGTEPVVVPAMFNPEFAELDAELEE